MRSVLVVTALFGLGVTVWGQVGAAPAKAAQRCRPCDEAGVDYDDPTGIDKAGLSGERIRPRTGPVLPVDEGAKGLAETLKKLRTRASLMLIVAHPDDEDGGMLAYEGRGNGVQTAMLTLTRGEGGQNLMSADFNDALGLVRTEELLAAGRYFGVDQMFGTEVDFGFSKTKEESFAQWGHDRVLYDAVRAVRLYRPLVIAAVFVGGLTDGHGQHQVSGEIAQEVYEAAGDPKVFPEMIAAGLEPWTPLKVYARVPFARVSEKGMFDYATGKYAPVRFYNYVTKRWTSEAPKANVTVPEGEASPLLGMSYVQFARLGLALQKSQIGSGERRAAPGKYDVGYTRYGSRVKVPEVETGFFDGIDVSLEGIAALAPEGTVIHGLLADQLGAIDGAVKQAAAEYTEAAPEKSAPALRDGLDGVNHLISEVEASDLEAEAKANVLHELRVKRVQFNTALVEALGLRLEAKAVGTAPLTASVDERRLAKEEASDNDPQTTIAAVPGEFVLTKVKVSVENPAAVGEVFPKGATVDVTGAGFSVHSWAVSTNGRNPEKAPRAEYEQVMAAKVPRRVPLTRPYFTRPDMAQPYYNVADAGMRNAPLPLPAMVAWTTMLYEKTEIRLGSAVMTGAKDAEAPVAVVPAISVMVSPQGGVVPLGEKTLKVTARVKTEVPDASGTVRLELPAGWSAEPTDAGFALKRVGDATDVSFTVTPSGLAAKTYTLTAVASYRGQEFHEGFRAAGYKGLEPVNVYEPATYRVTGADVKIAPGLKVGYLAGTGDSVADSLAGLGVHVTMLSAADVVAGKLAGYDAVVLGVRAYAAHPELQGAGSAGLLAYAQAGGVVIVQYVTGRFEAGAGPYPLALGSEERVVVEDDPVTLLTPADPVLTWPNRIGSKDFDGWVEERGHGFMGTWDARYEAPLEMHDPGQDPQKGGLLVARTGKGVWVYCALALYRQLPEGVPGAYRLLANLLSIGKGARR
jgi:LmbE family N-acetylglucosaminyl deacetylase